jgi:hypothetical protein
MGLKALKESAKAPLTRLVLPSTILLVLPSSGTAASLRIVAFVCTRMRIARLRLASLAQIGLKMLARIFGGLELRTVR